jgi:hypothetical protein
MDGQFPNLRVGQIRSNLGEIRPPVRRRVQIDECIAVAQYVCEYRMRDQRSNAAAGPSRESPIKVASV